MKEVKELGCSNSQCIRIPWTFISTLDFTGLECIASICLMSAPNSKKGGEDYDCSLELKNEVRGVCNSMEIKVMKTQ